MEVIGLLRGITPTGKNKIPKMASLVTMLQEKGFQKVRSFGQTGNLMMETPLNVSETAAKIHQLILEKISNHRNF